MNINLSARSYTHDTAGNTIQYGYDGLNRLTERSQPAMSVQLSHGETVALPAGSWRYEHDGLGRRTSKVELDGLGEPIETTRVRFGLICNDTLYHIHPDHLGRPEVITDVARNVVWRAVLHPWDRTVATTSIGEFNLGFPGQYRDAESGQWYNYFRTYDGSIGRYTQADPIGIAGGINVFSYSAANPISNIDPSGLIYGRALAELAQRWLGRNAAEAAYQGQMTDVALGALAGRQCSNNAQVQAGLDGLRLVGGVQAVGLGTATSVGFYGATATISSASAAVLLPVALTLYGSLETGRAAHNLYENARGGNTFGGDIHALVTEGRLPPHLSRRESSNCTCSGQQ